MNQRLYPQRPESVPKNYTSVSGSYRIRVLAVLLGIFTFVAVYCAMVAGSGYLIYYTVTEKFGGLNRFSIVIKIGAVLLSVMLFIFMIKFIFKKKGGDEPFNIEIKRVQHPDLFEFIRRVCREASAPMPKKVFVSHEVNAMVFYNNTFLSLFFPAKKNLLIGLGLLEYLNLREFKAALAHEFGHFSQGSMRLGSYVYTAHKIIYSMLYERDKWDDTLIAWKHSESLMLAAVAIIIRVISGLLRYFLLIFFYGLQTLHASLSREMEYHADRVAASLAGSDAIANALLQTEVADLCYMSTYDQLGDAIDHKIYTKNFFYHHERALEQLKRNDPEFASHMRKSEPGKMVFSPEWDFTPSMYDFHPSNFNRERNVKNPYITVSNTSPDDERPAKELFSNYRTLCEKVTLNLYQYTLDLPPGTPYQSPEEVQTFIDKEFRETNYDPKYHGVYDGRFITPVDFQRIDELRAWLRIDEIDTPALLDELHGDQLREKMQFFNSRHKEIDKVARILSGEDKKKKFKVGYAEYPARDAEKVLERLNREMEKEYKWLEIYDLKVFLTHLRIIFQLNDPRKDLFFYRYHFHYRLQDILKGLEPLHEELQMIVNDMMSRETVTEDDHDIFMHSINRVRKELCLQLDKSRELKMPAFEHLMPGQLLRGFLLEGEPVHSVLPYYHETQGVNVLYDQLEQVYSRAQRLYYKSLGGILALQESLSDRFLLQAFKGNTGS